MKWQITLRIGFYYYANATVLIFWNSIEGYSLVTVLLNFYKYTTIQAKSTISGEKKPNKTLGCYII
jgi:hypothetical protein